MLAITRKCMGTANTSNTTQTHFRSRIRVDDRRSNPHGIGGIGLIADDTDGTHHQMATVAVVSHGVGGDPKRKANARRLAACWNACQGLDTEFLEMVPAAPDATVWTRAATARLRKQHDDLLTDLRAAAETLRRYEASHRAKGTADSDAKAEVNCTLAARFEATIAKCGGAS